MSKSEYEQEVVVWNDEGQMIAGEWSSKQMDSEPFTIGYMDDPLEEVRSIPLHTLRFHVGLFGPTSYGKSTALRNLAVQIQRERFCLFGLKRRSKK